MRRWIEITSGLVGAAAVAGAGVLGLRAIRANREWREIQAALKQARATSVFDPGALTDLPAPARRYLRHALAEDAPLARSARIEMTGRMRPRPTAAPINLTAEELLAPPLGFQWSARFSMGPISVRVRDYYHRNDGGVRIEPFGVPVRQFTGPDVARSARHRLAAESVWIPSALLPGPGVTWEAIDEVRARVAVTVDSEAVPVTLTIDEAGRVQAITMKRHGNVDVPGWRPIPYGFAVEEEASFNGYTIPTHVRGGWWFGTERFRADRASAFHIHTIRYH